MAKQYFLQGYRAGMPLMVGVAPFGLVFGALATNAGLSVIEALGMSILVLAGSSQFIAAQLIDERAPVVVIVFTTFIVNLRHFLYSASLADFFRPLSNAWKALLGYLMVDEVYAVAVIRQRTGDLSPYQLRWYFAGVAFNLVSVWWGTTVIGALVGKGVPENVQDTLGFTLPLVFTAIIVPALAKRPALAAALTAGVSGILLAPLPHKLGLLAAAAAGITAGVLVEVYQIRHTKEPS